MSSGRDALADRLLAVAEFSHAHWFFGNLYEALVKVPHRIAASEASHELPRSPFGAGSPGRYYAPIAPVNAPVAVAALAAGWPRADGRILLVVAAAASTTGAAATAYLLRSINPALARQRSSSQGQARAPNMALLPRTLAAPSSRRFSRR